MSDKYEPAGIFATPEQAANVTAAFNLDYRTPIMAVGIGHKLVGAPEEFRDMANRYAVESGLKAVRERARKDDAKTPAPLPYYRRFERRQRNQ